MVEAQIARGAADADGALAAGGYPLRLGCGPVLQLALGDVKADRSRLAGCKVNAIEGHECTDRELHARRNFGRRGEIDLRNFVGIHAAGVLDVQIDIETTISRFEHAEAGVVEGGVTEAVSEGKKRFDILLVKPAVAYVDTLAVSGFMVDALVGTLGILWDRWRGSR